jgi:RNA polymerase sigma-70 factor (ECF subfamily)
MPVLAPEQQVRDADLIAAWRGGDEGAATQLVQRHAEPLARFLRAAGAQEDLEDLVQETLFRAFRSIDTYKGGASFRSWLIAIGSNALKDSWRKRKRRQVLPLEDRDFEDEASDPEGEAAARDMEGRLMAGLDELSPMQRDVFLLRAQQGVEYQDIAEALGTSAGAARVHYHQAVKRLRKLME